MKRVGRFDELSSARGTQRDFEQLNIIYAPNGSGKTTICDILRSTSTGNASLFAGRKRLDADSDPEIFIKTESENGTEVVRFQDRAWQNGVSTPSIHVYDDRFVTENVLIGHHMNVDQRRNLYGLAIGSHAIELKECVELAEQNLTEASAKHASAAAQAKSRILNARHSQTH